MQDNSYMFYCMAEYTLVLHLWNIYSDFLPQMNSDNKRYKIGLTPRLWIFFMKTNIFWMVSFSFLYKEECSGRFCNLTKYRAFLKSTYSSVQYKLGCTSGPFCIHLKFWRWANGPHTSWASFSKEKPAFSAFTNFIFQQFETHKCYSGSTIWTIWRMVDL